MFFKPNLFVKYLGYLSLGQTGKKFKFQQLIETFHLCFCFSLNREKRIRELLQITQENQEILKRITMAGPQYNTKQLLYDWEQNQKYMDYISCYPQDWWKKDVSS